MLYRHKETGAEFQSNSDCKGEKWEKVTEKKPTTKKPKGADK